MSSVPLFDWLDQVFARGGADSARFHKHSRQAQLWGKRGESALSLAHTNLCIHVEMLVSSCMIVRFGHLAMHADGMSQAQRAFACS